MSPRGPAAESIADLTVLMVALGALVYLLFLGLLIIALRRGGSRPLPGPGPESDEWSGIGDRGARRLVVGGGLVLPIVVISIVYVATLETMLDLSGDPSPDSLTVEVIGSQWQWRVRYPDSGVELVDELYLPIDRPVKIELRSVDVIHSFWVPDLAGKVDALPDRTNTMVIEAAEAGRFDGRCAEFCGLLHGEMDITVVVLESEEFDTWLSTASSTDDLDGSTVEEDG